jgi:WD40 repeat protein
MHKLQYVHVNIDTGAIETTFDKHSGQVNKLLRINSQQVITASADSIIKLWNLSNGSYVCGYHNHTASVKSVLVSPNGLLVTGGCDGLINIWNTTNGGLLVNTFEAHTGCVNDLKYHQNLSAVISVRDDRLVKVRAWATLTNTLGPVNASINCVGILRNGNIVAGSNRIDMWSQAYDLQTPPAGVFPNGSYSTEAILSMTLLADGLTVACGLSDGRIRFFSSVRSTFQATILDGHSNQPVNGLDFILAANRKEVFLMSGSDDMHVNIWAVSTIKA